MMVGQPNQSTEWERQREAEMFNLYKELTKMTQHQKAQQVARNCYNRMVKVGYSKQLSWDVAMGHFKLEMQK